MGKIEEVTDENFEKELVDEKKESKKKSESDDGEVNEDKDSQVSDEEDDGSDDDLDFTKSVSKEELLGDIKSYSPAELQGEPECSECEDCDGGDGGDQDFFEDSSKSSTNMGSKRGVAFLILFPMVVSGGYMLYEVFGKFKLGKSSMQFTAAIGGAIIALFIMSNVKQLQSAVKFVLCFAWLVFLYPSYQVYHCSPVPLKNDMLGTWFSLKTESSKFLELSYVTSECFQSYQFHSPYMLSLMSVKISLTVDISDLINLNVGKDEPNIEDETPVYNYFLLVSKRSVKKKFHKLNMITEAAPKLATVLKESLKLSSIDKEKKLLRITGMVEDIGELLSPMKKELEGYGYLIRPIKFKVYKVKYIDRYAKLKNNPEGYY